MVRVLPVLNHGVDCVDEAVLGNRVEKPTRSSLVAYSEMSAGVWVR